MSQDYAPQAPPPAGWYPDPEDTSRIRFWDGTSWAAPQDTVALSSTGEPLAPPPPPPSQTTPPATYAPAPYVASQPAAYVPPTPAPKANTLAIVSLILGCAAFVFGLLLGIAAIITGVIARRQLRTSGESGEGMALAGIITGIVSTIIWTIAGIAIALLVIAARHVVADLPDTSGGLLLHAHSVVSALTSMAGH